MRKCLIILVLLLSGCQRAINETDMGKLQEVVHMMDDLGLAGYAEVELGDGKIYMHNEWGLNLGTIRVRVLSRPSGRLQD